jgi:hypothetical protein
MPTMSPVSKEFTQALRLTSPLTHGQKVEDCQYLLKGHSRFKGLATYKDGKVDGVYGPVTAAAVKRAKFWLGYPLAACDRIFGQTVYEYLRVNHWRPLPVSYQDRRAARLAAAVKTPGQLALAEAATHLGYRESPFGSNDTIFGAWYGLQGQPWCAVFESYCFGHTGSGFRYSYVPDIYHDARNGLNRLQVVWTPKPGDLALYDIGGEQLAHTAFVHTSPASGRFEDLGGNTGPINVSNGGEVLIQRRPTSMVHAYVRVG